MVGSNMAARAGKGLSQVQTAPSRAGRRALQVGDIAAEQTVVRTAHYRIRPHVIREYYALDLVAVWPKSVEEKERRRTSTLFGMTPVIP